MLSNRQLAIITGTAVLIMTIAAIVSTDLTIESLIVPDNPNETFENIKNNQMLFRVGIFAWIIVLICDIVIAWGLYLMFKSQNGNLSLLMGWTRLVYSAILATSIGNLIQCTLLFQFSDAVQPPGYLIAESWLYVQGFYSVWSMGLLIFGIHIVLLGLLSFKSDYIPRWLGILLMIGGIGYLLVHSAELLDSGNQQLIKILGWIFILPMLSEVALGLWLIIKRKSFAQK